MIRLLPFFIFVFVFRMLILPEANAKPNSVKKNISIYGKWSIYSDEHVKAKSKWLFYYSSKHKSIVGKVVRLYHPEFPGSIPKCSKCKGINKNAPVIGMVMIWGLKKGKSDEIYENGIILNPDTGETHSVTLELVEDGKKMKIIPDVKKPYKNSNLLGESLVWEK